MSPRITEKEALEGIIAECSNALSKLSFDDPEGLEHYEQLLEHAQYRLWEIEGKPVDPLQLELNNHLVDVLTGDVYMTNIYGYAEPFQGTATEAINMNDKKIVKRVVKKPGKPEAIAGTDAPPAEFSSVEELCAYAESTYGMDKSTVLMHFQLLKKENDDNPFTLFRLAKQKVDELGKLRNVATATPSVNTPSSIVSDSSTPVAATKRIIKKSKQSAPSTPQPAIIQAVEDAKEAGLSPDQIDKLASLARFEGEDNFEINFISRLNHAIAAYKLFETPDAEPVTDNIAERITDKLLSCDEKEAALVEIDMAISRLKGQKARKQAEIDGYREYYRLFLEPRMEAWLKEKVGGKAKDRFVDLNTGRVALVQEPERFVIEDRETIITALRALNVDLGLTENKTYTWDNNKAVAYMKQAKKPLPGYTYKPSETVVRVNARRT